MNDMWDSGKNVGPSDEKIKLLFVSIALSMFISYPIAYLFFNIHSMAHFVIFSFVFSSGYFFNAKDINIKERGIKSLQIELNDLMFNETELVTSAYRSSVSSNSFGKKNYSKFKKELLEHLLENTESKDVLRYVNELGEFQIPDETIYKIEDVKLLCSNCHRRIHHTRPAKDFDFLTSIINKP
jgi:hypothetical protein